MEKQYVVSPSPHLHSGRSTSAIMLDVIYAMLPAVIASVWLFGWKALMVEIVCIASCIAAEYLSCVVLKKAPTVGDLSCVVTGLLLAFNLPATIPLWQAVLGCVVAIVVVKEMFGGIGHNFVNPALAGRIVLMSSFAEEMTSWNPPLLMADTTSSATPLAQLGLLNAGETSIATISSDFPLWQMLFGLRGGCLGETCALALLIGFLFLVWRHVISPTIPLVFAGTVFVLVWLLTGDVLTATYHLLSGGLLLGAVFMATDYTTSPINLPGKVVFAIGCGLITVLIRLYGSLPEGVSFAIIIMNILVPLIERATRSIPFGERRFGREAG